MYLLIKVAGRNSFAVLAKVSDKEGEGVEIRPPTTFLEIFEAALGSCYKGPIDKVKSKVGLEEEFVESVDFA